MTTEPETPPASGTLVQKIATVAGDVFEEAKMMFFGAVLCVWASLALCHYLKEAAAFSSIATAITAMFTGLVAKMAWGKD